MPLKISTEESLSKSKHERQSNKGKDTKAVGLLPSSLKPQVTGTDADLRRLTKGKIKQKLVDLGYDERDLEGQTRWTMVGMLKNVNASGVAADLCESD